MYEYKATLVRVVDGDTLDCMTDLGFNCHVKIRVRLYGVDTWESRTRDKEEKKKGLLAKQFVVDSSKKAHLSSYLMELASMVVVWEKSL